MSANSASTNANLKGTVSAWWRRASRAACHGEANARLQRIAGLTAAFRRRPCPCLKPDRCTKAGGCICHDELAKSIDVQLTIAKTRLAGPTRNDWRGVVWNAIWSSLDEAEAQMLRLAPDAFVIGQLPATRAFARSHLRPGDERLQRLQELTTVYSPPAARTDAGAAPGQAPSRRSWKRLNRVVGALSARGTVALSTADREAVVAAFAAAAQERLRAVERVRNFRNILSGAALVLMLAAIGLGALTASTPRLLPLCFTPVDTAVCPTRTGPEQGAIALARDRPGGEAALEDVAPSMTVPSTASPSSTEASSTMTPSPEAARAINHAEVLDRVIRDTARGWDVPLIELLGALAAAVTAAFALRSLNGTATPFSLPLALAFLKIPAGALTAVLGLLLLRGGFVPGFSNLDDPAQIVAWAIVFGGAQQLVTRLIDSRAENVLDKVGAPGTAKAADGTTVKIGDTSSGA
jgi:hypothetical protein